MKFSILLAFVSSWLLSSGQTPLIAHKSHSGRELSYLIDPNSNFGRNESYDPPKESIVFDPSENQYYYSRINDTMVLKLTLNNSTVLSEDTLRKPKQMTYRKFKKSEMEKNSKVQRSMLNPQFSNTFILNIKDKLGQNKKLKMTTVATKKSKKSTPSFLLILLGVSAVVTLLIRLMFGSRKPSTV